MGLVWLSMGRRQERFPSTVSVGHRFGAVHSGSLCMGNLLADCITGDRCPDDGGVDRHRRAVRITGRVMYHLQRFFGGTPEAVDAEYHGPGTGSTPETAELRKFKAGSHDKWIVLKRAQDVVVFRVGSEAQAIR